MTKDQIIEEVKNSPLNKVKLAICDIDGILRGKVIHKEKFLSVVESGFGFCDVVFGWDAADLSYDNGKFTGWHTGYPDAQAAIDLNTFRKVPWDNEIPFFLADFKSGSEKALEICPRSLLKKITAEAHELGFTPFFSQEFEWFNFKETSQSLADKQFSQPQPITPGMFGYSLLRATIGSEFFNNLFDQLEHFGVPLEGLHTETGPGVFEAAIMYSEILEAADRAVLFKTGAKEIAYKHNVMATFMAKWNEELPGCSGHVHQSLWDEKKKINLFFDEKKEHQISDLMESYMAGQLHCLPFILPMVAPTINSYKRLVEGAWAPTTLTWGIDNRTVALRALPGSKKSTRLETRVVGSDVNPYLAMSACLAAGLYGIKNKLKLTIKPTKGNGYEDFSNGTLPSSLEEATSKMKNSQMSKELFGEEFVDHFVRTREWEVRQFAQKVTDWELKRYFEII
ncbi:MAG: glutamine synthetase family protein [Flammeovirgaceae bacterium]|nr:glutamine synthetase family protein [Flammeovirgaceae bacterium]